MWFFLEKILIFGLFSVDTLIFLIIKKFDKWSLMSEKYYYQIMIEMRHFLCYHYDNIYDRLMFPKSART